MSEQDIMDRTKSPITVRGIVDDLRALGVKEGDKLLVHSSLSAIGWVCGGAQAVVQALLQTVGEVGTLVMPAQSGEWSDPAEWGNPPVPHEWIEIIYKEMPAFDPAITPTRGMGRIAELFRSVPGTMRSDHPQVSFCTNGHMAEEIVSDHPLTPQFGMDSPLGKLYSLSTKVLLLGVGYDSCTSFHLSEAMLERMPIKRMGTAIMEDGVRVWKWFDDYAYDSGDFDKLGEKFEAACATVRGKIGNADCVLFEMREAVNFGVEWLTNNRAVNRE